MPRRKRRARGHIEQLPSGSHRAIVYAAIDPLTGHRRDLKATADDYDEAEKALARLQVQVDEQRQPKAAITLGQAIDGGWKSRSTRR
jgi:integrase